MRIIVIILSVGFALPPFSAYAGRDGAQLMLQEQLNKRAAAAGLGRKTVGVAPRVLRGGSAQSPPEFQCSYGSSVAASRPGLVPWSVSPARKSVNSRRPVWTKRAKLGG